ncbi:Plant transposase Ptta/En/Spm family, partial [Fagus crenata]
FAGHIFTDSHFSGQSVSSHFSEILPMARSARKNAATTSTGESSTSENGVSGVGNKSGRGFTRNLKLLKIFKGQRFPITWTNRRPVGKYSKVFKSECTALVRQIQNAPLQVKEWRHVPYEKKKKLFDNVLEHFIVEGQETLVWQQMNRSYKNYRNSLKKKWFDPYGDDHEEARENLPPNIAQDDWNYLVNLWSDKDWKDMCEKNKISRSQNLIIHITGSKSFQQRKEEEKEKTGEELGRVQLFEVTHVRANGLAINEHTQEAL